MPVIVIPTHACSADDGRLPASDVYGDLDPADNVATCAMRVRWGFQRGQDERVPGCGARIAVCHGCGLRTRVNGAPCDKCGGDERPSPEEMLTSEAPRASSVDVDPSRSIVQDETVSDAAAKRETKEKPAARRAPAKRVKKGAAPDGAGLPLFK